MKRFYLAVLILVSVSDYALCNIQSAIGRGDKPDTARASTGAYGEPSGYVRRPKLNRDVHQQINKALKKQTKEDEKQELVGTNTWWDDRENAEFNAQQLNDQFGDANGDDNNSYMDQEAVYTNRQGLDLTDN